jgi:hypothetical protein
MKKCVALVLLGTLCLSGCNGGSKKREEAERALDEMAAALEKEDFVLPDKVETNWVYTIDHVTTNQAITVSDEAGGYCHIVVDETNASSSLIHHHEWYCYVRDGELISVMIEDGKQEVDKKKMTVGEAFPYALNREGFEKKAQELKGILVGFDQDKPNQESYVISKKGSLEADYVCLMKEQPFEGKMATYHWSFVDNLFTEESLRWDSGSIDLVYHWNFGEVAYPDLN